MEFRSQVFVVITSCLITWYCCHVLGHVHFHRSHFTHLLAEETNVQRSAMRQCQVEEIAGKCVDPMQCPAHVHKQEGVKDVHCSLLSGRTGICCTTGQNHTDVRGHHKRMKFPRTSLVLLKKLMEDSQRTVHELMENARNMLVQGHTSPVQYGTPSFGHFQTVRMTEPGMDMGTMALESVYATRRFKEENDVSIQDLQLGQVGVDLRETGPQACPIPPKCIPARYRSQDGTCNNQVRPLWGAARSPMERLLPPRYSDGVWSPRVSVVDNQPLPSARMLSTTLFPDVDTQHRYSTLMLMQFGQFIAHDVTLSPSFRYENGSGISCCEKDGRAQVSEEFRHFACYPIIIPEDDPFYSRFGQRCMNFVRGMLAPRYDCALGYAQQMNSVSHFVDGSAVYGVDTKLAMQLRSFQGGRLLATREFGRDLPPLTSDPAQCAAIPRGSSCFHGGDVRTNQMIGLVVMQQLFMREHNRLADELSVLNPHWSDEVLFQEARRIVIAEIQHILYAEWLPIVLGMQAMADYGLSVTDTEHTVEYDPNVNPSTTNEFTVAAFRFGHSTVDGLLKLMHQDTIGEQIFLPDVMFNPSRMHQWNFYDGFLNTLTSQPMQQVDSSITQGLTNYMFRGDNPFGMDLGSLNIQRGLDHGIGTYNDYRELAGVGRAVTFHGFGDRFSQQAVNVLQQVYASPEDVDLFVGGLLEKIVPGAVVGPTFLGIIADQFSRTKHGDRFFYENGDQPHSFTKPQLKELKQTMFARIICDNSDHVEILQQPLNAFLRRDHPGNTLLNCFDPALPRMNLEYWKDLKFPI